MQYRAIEQDFLWKLWNVHRVAKYNMYINNEDNPAVACGTIEYSTVQYSTVQYSVTHSEVQYSTVQYNTVLQVGVQLSIPFIPHPHFLLQRLYCQVSTI